MKKEELDRKFLHDAVDKAERACIVMNDGCIAIQADPAGLMSLLSMLAETVKDEMPEEVLIKAIHIGYMSREEQLEMAVKAFKDSLTGGE